MNPPIAMPRLARRLPPTVLVIWVVCACGSGAGDRPLDDAGAQPTDGAAGGTRDSGAEDGGPQGALRYVDVTESHLPAADLAGLSMDAKAADVDGDGDMDLIVANEFGSNFLLINDGEGRFANESDQRIPRDIHDSEDVAAADFDEDGDIDIVIVSEDDQVNEMYLNLGAGVFEDQGQRLPVTQVTNGVDVGDVDGDGHLDLVLANNGQNTVLMGDGTGQFSDETATRMPTINDVTQDVEFGDIDGDGDLDLLVGNEGDNRILINNDGRFADESSTRLPLRAGTEETREADLGDVDGDGDLDIAFANVLFFRADAVLENRLLINDGNGSFRDESASRLPQHADSTVDIDFIDIDGDGDLDMVTGNGIGTRAAVRYRVFVNDGDGFYTDASEDMFPATVTGIGFDVEAADYNGDGAVDLFLASRRGRDRLLLQDPSAALGGR